MKLPGKHLSVLLALTLCLGGCKKETPAETVMDEPPVQPQIQFLKEAVEFPVGVAISLSPMLNDAAYANLVKREFDAVTFDFHMKHGAVVQHNGSFNFTQTDALVNASSGLQIFGHTLGWHQNQNASYLKNIAGIIAPSATELITNGGFEDGLSGWSTFNSGNPSGSATITGGSGAAEVRSGNGSLKVVNPTPYSGNQWRVQVSSAAFTTTPGKQYIISYWVKAVTAGGSIRLSTGPSNAQYQSDQVIGTDWQQVNFTLTASLPSTTFLFDLGQAANTYYIDDVSVREVTETHSGGQITQKLDEALRNFITTIATRYKGKVSGWDVVNELFTENGSLRNNSNTDITPADVFVWSHYLDRDYPLKAFQYAAAADPNAALYINDYNLETSPRKLDSLVAFVAELKSKGAKVDGIGTQMHISWNTSQAGIDNMFRKLAATGLKVRVSELDVRVNPQSAAGFVMNAAAAANQANMYKYVAQSYLKQVPAAQRAGITIWGVTDNTSWLYNNGLDFPLLFDAQYTKKAAYTGFMDGLKWR